LDVPNYRSERLSSLHSVAQFDSGKPNLDDWLRNTATNAQAMGTGRTFVWHGGGVVVAYYTIAAHLVVRDHLPKKVGRGSPEQIPSVLLARLALDKTLHGRGLGGALLADALGRIVEATQTVAARLVVVDAIDEYAHGFYSHHGFTAIPETMRLVQKINDISAALLQ
jgi:GNAT superfamily N-acetyltransferase